MQHRLLGARVAELDVAQLEPAVRGAGRPRLLRRGATRGSVSSTSLIRSAQTAARGTSTNMKVAIITDIRICTR